MAVSPGAGVGGQRGRKIRVNSREGREWKSPAAADGDDGDDGGGGEVAGG